MIKERNRFNLRQVNQTNKKRTAKNCEEPNRIRIRQWDGRLFPFRGGAAAFGSWALLFTDCGIHVN
jgi:hypothetical protein